jgi:hypothetical protein
LKVNEDRIWAGARLDGRRWSGGGDIGTSTRTGGERHVRPSAKICAWECTKRTVDGAAPALHFQPMDAADTKRRPLSFDRAAEAIGSLAGVATLPSPYPPSLSDEDAMRAAWDQVGSDMREAIEVFRGQEKPRTG